MSRVDNLLKPENVVLAVRLFYVVVGIGVVRTMMTVLRHVDVRSPYFLIFTKLMVYLFALFVIYQLGCGKNWARWLLVVILAITIPISVIPSFDAISSNTFHSLLGFLQLALAIVAFVFIFQKKSSDWYESN